jgi:hypothetical protein
MKAEDYIVEVDEIDPQGNPYKCPIKVACMHRFLSAEENWEAIYDLLIVVQSLSKNSLVIVKNKEGFLTDILWNPIEIDEDIITFAFQNVWKFAQLKEKNKLSENIIARSRRLELEQFIIDKSGGVKQIV